MLEINPFSDSDGANIFSVSNTGELFVQQKFLICMYVVQFIVFLMIYSFRYLFNTLIPILFKKSVP